MKIELAPARKASAWVSSLIVSRPADSRTTERGIMTRAAAIARTNSIPSSGSASASGVPSTRTSMLMGTLSGWRGIEASAASIAARSARLSPIPAIPPQQTDMPAARTRSSVSSRSAKPRVVTISP